MSDKDTLLWQTLDPLLRCVRGNTPCEIVNVLLHELPTCTQVLRSIKFLVYLAWFAIAELLAVSPSGSECPCLFNRVELELMNLLA